MRVKLFLISRDEDTGRIVRQMAIWPERPALTTSEANAVYIEQERSFKATGIVDFTGYAEGK